MHGWWNMSYYWIEKSRLAACVHHDPTWPNLPNIFFNPKSQTHFPAENRFRNALRHQNETTNATRSCASDPVSNAKILIFHVVSKIWQKNKEKVDNFRVWDFCSKKKGFHNLYKFSGFAFLCKRKKTTWNFILVMTTYKLSYVQYLSYNLH